MVYNNYDNIEVCYEMLTDLIVSPRLLLMDMLRSSAPSASRFCNKEQPLTHNNTSLGV